MLFSQFKVPRYQWVEDSYFTLVGVRGLKNVIIASMCLIQTIHALSLATSMEHVQPILWEDAYATLYGGVTIVSIPWYAEIIAAIIMESVLECLIAVVIRVLWVISVKSELIAREIVPHGLGGTVWILEIVNVIKTFQVKIAQLI